MLTITQAKAIALKHGILPATAKRTEGKNTVKATVILQRDIRKERDAAMMAETIQDIMKSREEAQIVMANPF